MPAKHTLKALERILIVQARYNTFTHVDVVVLLQAKQTCIGQKRVLSDDNKDGS